MSLLKQLAGDLPPDPSEAIIKFASSIRQDVLNVSPRPAKPEDYTAIASFILKFIDKYSLSINLSKLDSDSDLNLVMKLLSRIEAYRKTMVREATDAQVTDLLIKYDSFATRESFGLAHLNTDEKKKIHESIGRIRSILETSTLSDRKKNALYDRLNELAREVDASGTMTDRFFALAGDIGFVMGDVAEKAKPLLREVKEVLRIVTRARARQEGISLPPGDEVLRLPAPDELSLD
jgi:hypothetical protein